MRVSTYSFPAFSVALATLLVTPSIAEARPRGGGGGRLGSVVGGIRSSGGGSRGGGSHGSRSGGSRHSDSHHQHTSASGLWTAGAAGGATGLALPPPTVDLYAGVQRVVESEGAVTGELRLAFSRVALIGQMSGYRESLPGAAPVELDLAAGGAGFELLGAPTSKLWLEGVIAGVRTAPPDRIVGIGAGLRLEHALSPSLSLVGAARRYSFERDVQATEAVVGVQASFLRASYRVLDFDVGPALRGPEIGIALRF